MCLHSDSLGSLIKTLYFLFSLLHFFFLFFLPDHPTFLFFWLSYSFCFVPPLCSNLSQQLSFHQSLSVFLWAPPHVTPSLTWLPSICHQVFSSFIVSCFSLFVLPRFIQSRLHVKFNLSYFVPDLHHTHLLFPHISLYTGNSLYWS